MIDILILGGSGFIGGRTAQFARAAGLSVAVTHKNRPAPDGIASYNLDLSDVTAMEGCLRKTKPQAVLHCAISYGLQSEAEQMQISAESVASLLRAFRSVGVSPRLVYVSTNAVFSGRHGPYHETDIPDPDERADLYKFYGLGRRAGEVIALTNWDNTIIARTANVDGLDAWGVLNPRLRSLIDPLRRLQPLPRYVDRTISPTLVDVLAEALVEVSQGSFPLPIGTGRILHLAGRTPITDYHYARLLARRLGVSEDLVKQDHYLPPGSMDQYSIGLDVTVTQALLRTDLMDVEEMVCRLIP